MFGLKPPKKTHVIGAAILPNTTQREGQIMVRAPVAGRRRSLLGGTIIPIQERSLGFQTRGSTPDSGDKKPGLAAEPDRQFCARETGGGEPRSRAANRSPDPASAAEF